MRAVEKLTLFREAYRKFAQARRNRDMWAANANPPQPKDFAITGPAELHMARQIAEQIDREMTRS